MSKASDDEAPVENIVELRRGIPLQIEDDPLEMLLNEFSYLDDEEFDFPSEDPYAPFNGDGMAEAELLEYIHEQMKTLQELKARIKFYMDEIEIHTT